MTKRQIASWVIPPEQDAECVACMADVLATDAEAYDPKHPVRCMDEQPVQWLKETRVPSAATAQHGQRGDDEDERQGTASMFLFAAPLSGFRQATARPRRTTAVGDRGRAGDRRRATPLVRMGHLGATTSPRTPKARSMKRANRTSRACT